MTKGNELRYLKREKNLKSRRYFIETDYINGVKDSSGKYVMRPLTQEEKEFLNKYYKEVVNAQPKDFYTSKEDKSKIYNENNARNRDVYTNARITGRLKIIDPVKFDNLNVKDIYENPIAHFYEHSSKDIDIELDKESDNSGDNTND